MTQYGIPALFSLIFPGLGQVVKKQLKLALAIVGLVLCDFAIALVLRQLAGSWISIASPTAGIILSILSSLFVIFGAIVWIWSIVDAYNRPI